METTRQAFFINKPRAITDLMSPHFLDDEEEFFISQRIELRPIDYENFITDFLVERDYIESAANLDDEQKEEQYEEQNYVSKCLLISKAGNTDGVLVIPQKNGFIERAAYLSEYMLSNPA